MDQMKIGNDGDYFICNASIVGNNNRIWGHRNSVTGNGNQVCGNCNTVVGNSNTVKGLNNSVVGADNSIFDLLSVDTARVQQDQAQRQQQQQQQQQQKSPDVSVNICNRTRVRIDSQGRRSCDNFHVELIEHGAAAGGGGGGGPRQNSSCPSTPKRYDLSSLDGVDSEVPPAASSQASCSVCLSRERCVKLSPCRHVPMCVDCARRLFSGARTRTVLCPLCRSPVEEIERLFLS